MEALPKTTSFSHRDCGLDSLITQEDEMKDYARLWNLPLPTLGGKQFWTDYRWWQGWRVQYNGTFNHWRLLDPKSVRMAWGGRQAMLDELNKVAAANEAISEPTEVVLLLHGLMRSSSSMNPIQGRVMSRGYGGRTIASGDRR